MKINGENKSKSALILAMLIFGTVGIFSKHIPLPSGAIALARSLIGAVFLLLYMLVCRRKPDFVKIKENILLLLSSGICLGANWILFFMACKNTSIPTATLSYYLAPVILVLTSTFIFGEKLGVKQISVAFVALLGIALASGVMGGEKGVNPVGVLYGVMAAVLYATVVTLNKKMKNIDAVDKTLVQFSVSAFALLPYVFFVEKVTDYSINANAVWGLIIIGVLHTGIAYLLYFGAATRLKSATVAILSYIDPIISIMVSVLFFGEKIGVLGVLGAILVIGAAVVGEVDVIGMIKSNFGKGNSKKNIENVNKSEEL